MSTIDTTEPGRRAPTGVLVVACVSTLVVNANTNAVTILLPSIAKDVHASVSTLQWAVTGYALVGAAFIVTSGALGDVFGRRKVFLGGLILFIASCVLIATTNSQIGVIGGRAIQGAAGSTILASGVSLLTIASSGIERMRAVSIWGAATAAGGAAGPMIGGLLVGSTGWQGLFWIDALIAAVCIPVGLRVLEESRDPNRPRSIDWMGTILVASTFAPVILAVSEGSTWGWNSWRIWLCVAVAAGSVIGFLFAERRSSAPLVDLKLLQNRLLIGATLGILISEGVIDGLVFAMSLYFQDPHGLRMSPVFAGIATMPGTVLLIGTASLVPSWAAKFGTRTIIAGGFVVMALGFAIIGLANSSWTYAAFVVPFMLGALGASMSNGPCSSVATTVVPEGQVGAASGISNMARYVGSSILIAIAAAVYSTVSAGRLAGGADPADALASGFSGVAVAMAIASVLGIPLAILAGRHKPAKPKAIDRAAGAASHSHTIVAAEIAAQCA